jgi:Protein of unknown function (DUF3300)
MERECDPQVDDRNGKKVRAMKSSRIRLRPVRDLVALLCSALLVIGDPAIYAQPSTQDAAPQEQAEPKIPNDQLDSLVAPIALYPDPLLAQVLAASTYPLEIIQLQQWLQQHKDLKDKALADAVQKQDWDPSVQAMAPLPDALKQLAENLKWTTDLGNAFLAQQADVMDAVQRMREKAKDAGNLKSTEQQKVETKVVESKSVVVIEQANPQVVYVPSYNPTVVYGPPVYPYPPITYPPPGYYAAGMAISFGIGLAMGAAWGGGWGYGCGWGSNNNITINHNNNFVSNSNRTNINNRSSTRTGGGNWQHNPQHRGGAPYSNRSTANRYGGTARGDSVGDRQANARQNQGQRNQGQRDDRQRDSNPDRGSGGRQQAGTTDRGSGGADRVGNRQVPNTPSGSNKSAFSGGSRGTSGSAARTSSQRGSSSMGGSRGGSRGGGGGRRR